MDTNLSSCSVSGDAKHWFKWGNRLLWTRPINHDILSMSFMAFSLSLFCWIQNFTLKCHEVQLIQHIDLYLTTFACYRFFILQEAQYTANLALDFSNAKAPHISRDEIDEILTHAKIFSHFRRSGKTAFIVSSDINFDGQVKSPVSN
jgi:hypothetical protein